MEQKIQEIIEENGAKNTGKLRIFDNTLSETFEFKVSLQQHSTYISLDLIIDIFFSGKVDFKINADIHPAFPPPTTITLSFIMKLITTLYRKKINI